MNCQHWGYASHVFCYWSCWTDRWLLYDVHVITCMNPCLSRSVVCQPFFHLPAYSLSFHLPTMTDDFCQHAAFSSASIWLTYLSANHLLICQLPISCIFQQLLLSYLYLPRNGSMVTLFIGSVNPHPPLTLHDSHPQYCYQTFL